MPKRKYPITANEDVEQTALFEWVEWNLHIHPELEMMYHVPNEGKRSKWYGALLKALGLKPGVPDICLPVPKGGYHSLYIELKAHNNTLTQSQEEWLEKLTKYGNFAIACWGWEQAKNIIEKYLNGGITNENQ